MGWWETVNTMKDYIEERVLELARYIIDTGATVRSTAAKFRISKSTVHKDITERLREINPGLAAEVKEVLENNKAERHIRGGLATQRKIFTYPSRLNACCKRQNISCLTFERQLFCLISCFKCFLSAPSRHQIIDHRKSVADAQEHEQRNDHPNVRQAEVRQPFHGKSHVVHDEHGCIEHDRQYRPYHRTVRCETAFPAEQQIIEGRPSPAR